MIYYEPLLIRLDQIKHPTGIFLKHPFAVLQIVSTVLIYLGNISNKNNIKCYRFDNMGFLLGNSLILLVTQGPAIERI